MKIQKISYITKNNYLDKNNNIINQTNYDDGAGSVGFSTIPFYNDFAFRARVDKGLTRFYEVNKNRMPKTLKNFIEGLSNKELLTPHNANKLAFAVLAGVTSVAGIKEAITEDEDLVKDIKDIDEVKATRGILNTYRQNKDLFDKDDIVNGENLSVWLIKKILLESKTLEEINKDFIEDVNKDFYEFYRESEPEGQPIRHSTLKALGIKMPEKEYLTSLRYTREGYSDALAEVLSLAQQDAWARMTDEEKLNRATRFVLNVNKWWEAIPQDVKLEILSGQDAEIEFLKLYNEHKKEKADRNNVKEKAEKQAVLPAKNVKKEHINTGIKRDDELFKTWLKNNLEIKRAQLTPAEKQEITVRQQRKRAENWNLMSAEEQIDYISRMKSSSEQLRFAMFEAWNNNPELLIKLSIYLRKQNIERPIDILFGTSEFNKFQSQIMKDFWEVYPEFSTKLGESIKEAHQKVKDAKKDGYFDMLKEMILFEKTERENYIKNYVNNYREVLSQEEYDSLPEYMKTFVNVYEEACIEFNRHLPIQYLKDFYITVKEELEEDVVKSWTKALNNEELSPEDNMNLELVRSFEPPQAQIMNRALEATLADILYECTGNPDVYLLSQTDCKVAIRQIQQGDKQINILSNKTGMDFIFDIKNYKIDDKKIENLYKFYKMPVKNVTDILANYFVPREQEISYEAHKKLESYIENYGRSINHIFLSENKMSLEARNAFLQKFLHNMPLELKTSFESRLQNIDDLEKEEQINRIKNKLIHKYNFVSQKILNAYLFEICQTLRCSNKSSIDNFEELCCRPRKTTQEGGKIAVLRRDALADRGNLFTYLCIEQALADALYKATDDPNVYAFTFEELLDNMEVFNLVKKYPSENRHIKPQNINKEIDLRLLRKVPTFKVEEKTMEYVRELQEYTKECIEENKPLDKNEIMFILNPLEEQEMVDKATMLRIESVFEELNKVINSSRAISKQD